MKKINAKFQIFLMLSFALLCLLSFTGCEIPDPILYRECDEDRDYSEPRYHLSFSQDLAYAPFSHRKRVTNGDVYHFYDFNRQYRILLVAQAFAEDMCSNMNIHTSGVAIKGVEPNADGTYSKEIKYEPQSDVGEHCSIKAIENILETPEDGVSEGIVRVDFYHGDCYSISNYSTSQSPTKTMTVYLHYED